MGKLPGPFGDRKDEEVAVILSGQDTTDCTYRDVIVKGKLTSNQLSKPLVERSADGRPIVEIVANGREAGRNAHPNQKVIVRGELVANSEKIGTPDGPPKKRTEQDFLHRKGENPDKFVSNASENTKIGVVLEVRCILDLDEGNVTGFEELKGSIEDNGSYKIIHTETLKD